MTLRALDQNLSITHSPQSAAGSKSYGDARDANHALFCVEDRRCRIFTWRRAYCVDRANSTLCPGRACLDRQEVLDVKNARSVLIGMLVTAIALSILITPANAQPFFHPDGILITTYPQDIVVFPGSALQQTLAVVIKPPWYFDPGLMGFDSVTLTLTLSTSCYQCEQLGPGNLPTLAGANSNGMEVMQLGAVTMQESDNGMVILVPIAFGVDGTTSRGFYMLFLSAQANAADGTTFRGWTQIPVSVI
jgi:hypothetical protein